jgi:hypothetical protein
MVRGRTIDIKSWLYSPFLYYAIHNPPDDRYQKLIQPFVQKALEFLTSMIWSLKVRHRHHGTWYGVRNGTTAALSLIAAVKCGHIDVPDEWKDIVKAQIEALRYWEGETPDFGKARVVLQEMIDELSGEHDRSMS